ncbi:MAG: YncE family protein [Mycobacteriales bacterium]
MSSQTRSPRTARAGRLVRRLALPVVAGLVLVGCAGTPHHSAAPATTARNGPPSSSAPTRGPVNVYAHDGVGMFAPPAAHAPYLLYVPESAGDGVDVVDPVKMKIIAHYKTGLDPQHVVPSWDEKTLYSTNDLSNTLTPFDPLTGRPKGPNIRVDDPYNMYFTPDGRHAIIVAEARQHLDFRDPHTFALDKRLVVSCPGIDHGDFSADGSFAIFSCEFGGKMVKVDLRTETVAGYLTLPGSSTQDVKLSPDGKIFYAADMYLGGVHLISAATFRQVGFVKTGKDAHGLYISRDGRDLYVSNRGAGSVSVIDVATNKVVQVWKIPGGGSPDMGNVSPDGKTLWLSGRYNATVYAISTVDGSVRQIHVPNKPHGLCVWP